MQIELKNISKKYNNEYAVENISFTLNEGVTGLIGANGSGKTTTMKIMVDLLKPDTGEVKLNNDYIQKLGESYRDILGYLPQEFGMYNNFEVKILLEYIAYLKGIDNKIKDSRLNNVLNMFNLEEIKNKKYGVLSGGQKQRVGMAQAFLNMPLILILDEPTTGIDPKEQIMFREHIRNYKESIVLISSHIISDIESICENIIIIDKGRLIIADKTENILKNMIGKTWILDYRYETELEEKKNTRSYQYKGKPILRILDSKKPHSEAIEVFPILEDAYLWYIE